VKRGAGPAILLAAAVCLLVAAAATVQAARERLFPAPVVDHDALYLTSGAAARRLTVSLNPLAADVYWIRAIQYYGGAKRRLEPDPLHPDPPPSLARTTDYDQLYPLLDLTTTLDPLFDIAYRFGAVFLAEPYPGGPGAPELAVKLLQKGLRARPDKWEYMEDIGFVYYWYEHDYQQAASWFERASRLPGAPVWLEPLAASTLAKGGDRQSARLMWSAILQSAQVDWLKQQAQRRLLQFRALDEIDALHKVVGQYTARTGAPPQDWAALVGAGSLRGVPRDPAGVPYVIGADGAVTLSHDSPLFPLPDEPPRQAGPGRS
jgi:tetratricopeptide (TPR) repeat protein